MRGVSIRLPRFLSNQHAVDIKYWLEEYCCGNYKVEGCNFFFEEEKDATMFILKWT